MSLDGLDRLRPERRPTLKNVLWDMPSAREYEQHERDLQALGGRHDPALTDPSLVPIFARGLLLTLLVGIAWWALGCASMNQRCSYYPDGTLESYRIRSTVLGTGETELISTDCAVAAYSTKDTGLSDNGRAALADVAEAAARGAVGALVPGP